MDAHEYATVNKMVNAMINNATALSECIMIDDQKKGSIIIIIIVLLCQHKFLKC